MWASVQGHLILNAGNLHSAEFILDSSDITLKPNWLASYGHVLSMKSLKIEMEKLGDVLILFAFEILYVSCKCLLIVTLFF